MSLDTDSLVRRSARLQVEDLDLGVFTARPLDADSLRCLRYMHDVESHTVCYLRDMLVTRAHTDPSVTAFLTCWNYEEHWHGDAIGQVLDAHGELAGSRSPGRDAQPPAQSDALRPCCSTSPRPSPRHVIAVHMAWGAVNEWTTQAGYSRLAAKADHPVLGELLRRIMRQEGRHIDFYAAQARRRLADSRRRPAAPTRAALRRLWAPVGSGVMPKDEIRFLIGHLSRTRRDWPPRSASTGRSTACRGWTACIWWRAPWPSWPRSRRTQRR